MSSSLQQSEAGLHGSPALAQMPLQPHTLALHLLLVPLSTSHSTIPAFQLVLQSVLLLHSLLSLVLHGCECVLKPLAFSLHLLVLGLSLLQGLHFGVGHCQLRYLS